MNFEKTCNHAKLHNFVSLGLRGLFNRVKIACTKIAHAIEYLHGIDFFRTHLEVPMSSSFIFFHSANCQSFGEQPDLCLICLALLNFTTIKVFLHLTLLDSLHMDVDLKGAARMLELFHQHSLYATVVILINGGID